MQMCSKRRASAATRQVLSIELVLNSLNAAWIVERYGIHFEV